MSRLTVTDPHSFLNSLLPHYIYIVHTTNLVRLFSRSLTAWPLRSDADAPSGQAIQRRPARDTLLPAHVSPSDGRVPDALATTPMFASGRVHFQLACVS